MPSKEVFMSEPIQSSVYEVESRDQEKKSGRFSKENLKTLKRPAKIGAFLGGAALSVGAACLFGGAVTGGVLGLATGVGMPILAVACALPGLGIMLGGGLILAVGVAAFVVLSVLSRGGDGKDQSQSSLTDEQDTGGTKLVTQSDLLMGDGEEPLVGVTKGTTAEKNKDQESSSGEIEESDFDEYGVFKPLSAETEKASPRVTFASAIPAESETFEPERVKITNFVDSVPKLIKSEPSIVVRSSPASPEETLESSSF